jgi:hypothetical protein
MLVGYSQKWKSLCAISELFVGWKKYTTASSAAGEIVIDGILKVKSILFPKFLDHWA